MIDSAVFKIVIVLVVSLITLGQCDKRMAAEDHNGGLEYAEYQSGVQYDDYPVSKT